VDKDQQEALEVLVVLEDKDLLVLLVLPVQQVDKDLQEARDLPEIQVIKDLLVLLEQQVN
jgi:hypothetical protein